MRGQNYPYPIKLLYTSNIPLILLTVFISNLYYISAVLNQKFKGSYIAGFFGKWENDIIIGQSASRVKGDWGQVRGLRATESPESHSAVP